MATNHNVGGLATSFAGMGQYAANTGTSIADINAANTANLAITHAITNAKLLKEGADGAKEVA